MDHSQILSLHLQLCRIVLEDGDSSSWCDVYKLIPQLRRALACIVCGSIVNDPLSHSSNRCFHCVCLCCKGGKRRFNSGCNLCQDYASFGPNKQIGLVASAFRHTCQYMKLTDIFKRIHLTHGRCNLIDMIYEAADGYCQNESMLESALTSERTPDTFDGVVVKSEPNASNLNYQSNVCFTLNPSVEQVQRFDISQSHLLTTVPSIPNIPPEIVPIPVVSVCENIDSNSVYLADQICIQSLTNPSQTTLCPSNDNSNNAANIHCSVAAIGTAADLKPPDQQDTINDSNNNINGNSTMESSSTQQETNTIPIITASGLPPTRTALPTSVNPLRQVRTSKMVRRHRHSISMSQRRTSSDGCRCGNASAVPGILTCCGQRCPCYVVSRCCIRGVCVCRGCRNPHQPDGTKVLPRLGAPLDAMVPASVVPPCSVQMLAPPPSQVPIGTGSAVAPLGFF